MRIRVIALSVIVAGVAIVGASTGRPEDRTAARSPQIAAQTVVAPLPRLIEQLPDGAELIDLYKAARTVTDVEAANGKVKDQVKVAQAVASDLVRLHDAKTNLCEDVEQSHLEATTVKAKAFSDALAPIDSELTKSLATMRQRVAVERPTLTRAKDDVNRFTVAAHELSKLNVHTRELARAIEGVARNIRTTAASCLPTPIPPLFADTDAPRRRVVSVSRPRPTLRKRPANAVAKRTPFFPPF